MKRQRSRGRREIRRDTTADSQEELQRRLFHLKTLYDVSREIGFLIETRQIMKNLVMMTIGVFGAVRGVILLFEAATGKVVELMERGLGTARDGLVEAIGAGHFKECTGLVSCHAPATATALKAGEPEGISRALAEAELPVWIAFEVSKELVGGIGLGAKLSGEIYTPDDEELLTTLANQAAVAIQNATTHEQVVRYAEELAASLRRIQILESIRLNLAKFVPRTVQSLIEQSPDAPLLDKREADVSVMFADITGYTRLSAEMELDRVNRLVERYFSAFLDEIMRHGGDVNETAGDGLMVIFQDADARQHAEAAARTALAILRRTGEINEQLRGESEPITMRVGVNSGIASVGATKIEGLAGTRWTYTASGPTTNVAARLAALTEGGAVIISEETRRRLGEGFEVEDLGPQLLKNVAQPLRAYKALVCKPEPSAVTEPRERRRYSRQPVSWPVRLWSGSQFLTGRAVEASLYGVCIVAESEARLTPGESCRVDIVTRAGQVLTFVGEVRHANNRGVGIETKEPLPISEGFA